MTDKELDEKMMEKLKQLNGYRMRHSALQNDLRQLASKLGTLDVALRGNLGAIDLTPDGEGIALAHRYILSQDELSGLIGTLREYQRLDEEIDALKECFKHSGFDHLFDK